VEINRGKRDFGGEEEESEMREMFSRLKNMLVGVQRQYGRSLKKKLLYVVFSVNFISISNY